MSPIARSRGLRLQAFGAWAAWGLLVSGCAAPADPEPEATPPAPGLQGVTPDGNGAILAADTRVNRYAVLGEDAPRGAVRLTLSPSTPVAALGLRPDDLLLLYQAQGARIETRNSTSYGTILDRNGAGTIEIVGVSAVDAPANTITLYDWCGGLRSGYPAGSTQVVRIPQYQNLLVAKEGTLRAAPWDGQLGGIVAVRVEHDLTIDGAVDVSGQGFRGGASNRVMVGRLPAVGTSYRSANAQDGGNKGESVAGGPETYTLTGAFGRGAPANGGGGGNRVLGGGGGGANGGAVMGWTGQGVMPTGSMGEQSAWSLDPSYVANGSRNTSSPGGGRGGYSLSQQYADPRVTAPEDPIWGGDNRRERGGLGGRPVANDPKQSLFFGGGGGGGDNYQSAGGAGGSGGGLVLLIAGEIAGTGFVRADGAIGGSIPDKIGGGGGGGGGGTIVIVGEAVGGVSLSASGGSGGSVQVSALDASGPGGGGGGGFIATPPGSSATRSADGARYGVSTAGPMQAFPANGATAGKEGQVVTLDAVPFGGIPFCTTADLAIDLSGSGSPAARRNPSPYKITVTNLGPSRSSEVEVTLKLPATAEILAVDPQGWTCTIEDSHLHCSGRDLRAGEVGEITLTARPPLSATAGLGTALVRARSVDPNASNNTDDDSLDITEPLSAHALGGGLACGLSGGTPPAAAHGSGLLLLLLLLTRRRLGRRQRSCG